MGKGKENRNSVKEKKGNQDGKVIKKEGRRLRADEKVKKERT